MKKLAAVLDFTALVRKRRGAVPTSTSRSKTSRVLFVSTICLLHIIAGCGRSRNSQYDESSQKRNQQKRSNEIQSSSRSAISATSYSNLETSKSLNVASELRKALDPQQDGWDTEAIAEKCQTLLKQIPQIAELEGSKFVSPNVRFTPLRPGELEDRAVTNSFSVQRSLMEEQRATLFGRRALQQEVAKLNRSWSNSEPDRVEIKVFHFSELDERRFSTKAYYEASGRAKSGSESIAQQNATWSCVWRQRGDGKLELEELLVDDFAEVTSKGPWFVDVTHDVLAGNPSYSRQLLRGMNHWLRTIPESHGIHDAARHGLAVGDVNGDHLDDLYICQTGGLPNRLLVQSPDGRAEDLSERSGTDWLDATSSALIIDLDNDGDQDLVLAMSGHLILMENDGRAQFRVRKRLDVPDQATDVKSLCAADFDLDGDLDIYLCVDLAGEKTEAIVAFVYHDANDGGRNGLFANQLSEGLPWEFEDVTRATGLDVNNRRHSLAAAWEDYDLDGDQDLYVANDYGQNCLYRNDGGTFVDVAEQLGVVDYGSGMSVSWGDYNRDRRPDLYVSNMWSSAGGRITKQDGFRDVVDSEVLPLYRRFAKGNTLFENTPKGNFHDVGAEQAVEMGRWAWSSLFADINNDGWEDLLVANGYLTSPDENDL